MPLIQNDRRAFALSLLASPLFATEAWAAGGKTSITRFGAATDAAINTEAIQAAIDHLAAIGGGTVFVPAGVFVSGALFFKPRVHLHLAEGAVLRCTTEMSHFPRQRTRIEGHFEEHFTPGLINADGCDGFSITGAGTLDGAGRPIWDLFWKLRRAAPDPRKFPNLSIERARLAVIQNSKAVVVDGVTFKDSQFWNLHLYKCQGVQVSRARFIVPDDYQQAPSTDGIDLDSCQDVRIESCFFSLTDDCIAAKGSKGPRAMDDKDSPPVSHVRVRNCEFRRGHQGFACGSEATVVRDVLIEDCRVTGGLTLLMLKLRLDTPQTFEDIHLRNITLDHAAGQILVIAPWSQYTDMQGAEPPKSTVRHVTLTGFRGRYGSLGMVQPNPGQTSISGVVLKDFRVDLASDKGLSAADPGAVTFDDVFVNGEAVLGARSSGR